MGKNIIEMIDDLDGESSVKDFKDILKEREAQHKTDLEELGKTHSSELEKRDGEMKVLNEKFQDVLEKAVKSMDGTPAMSVDEKAGNLFRAIRREKTRGMSMSKDIHKYGGIPTIDSGKKEWKESQWIIGDGKGTEKAALGTVLRGDATTGSYMVPAEYASEMFKLSKQSSVMMGKVRTVPMSARDMYWPKQLTTSSLTWVTDETTAKTESAPTFEQPHLECETCAAWFAVTDELIEDSLVDLASYTREMFGEAWGAEFDKQTLNSNGAPFTSMLYNTSCQIRNMSAGSTSFANVKLDDIIDMENDISGAVGEPGLIGAYLIMSRYVFNVLKKQKDDNGEYIFQRPGDGLPGTIWNYPYLISDQMPGSSSDAVDTPFLILGNPKYWLHGNRVGMQFKVYDQTYANMEYDEVFFRFRIRQAFVAAIPEAFAVLETAAA